MTHDSMISLPPSRREMQQRQHQQQQPMQAESSMGLLQQVQVKSRSSDNVMSPPQADIMCNEDNCTIKMSSPSAMDVDNSRHTQGNSSVSGKATKRVSSMDTTTDSALLADDDSQAYDSQEGEGFQEGSQPGTTKAQDNIFNSKIAFPLNLTRMLEAVGEMGKTDIINWADDGRSFIIYDVDKFLVEVLPKFFK